MSEELAVAVLGTAMLGMLALAGWWVVGHPERVRAGLAWVAERPAVEWVRSRYPRQWGFVGRRFAPGEAAGLTLTLGLIAVLALGVGFGKLADSVVEADGVTVADRPVLGYLVEHREPWSITVARVITDMGSPIGVGVIAVLVGALVCWLGRSWLPLPVVLLGGAGIAALNLALKTLVGRQRPPSITMVVGEHGYSFPSGHTTGTTVVWLLSAWLVCHWVIAGRAARIAVWSIAGLMIVAVGLSRAFLGVHFLSDVLAGWTLGTAWALTIVLAVTVWEQSQWIPARLRRSS